MKHGLKLIIAVVLVGTTLLTACGKGGGGSNAAPSGSFAGTPAGYIGNGTWSGQVAVPNGSQGNYYQLAALAGLCFGQSCQQSYFRVTIQLRSNGYGGGYYPYPGQQQPAYTVQTQAAFQLQGSSGTPFTRQNVYITGGSANFSMRASLLYNNSYNQAAYGQTVAPAAGEPFVQINGQFTDQSQSVLNVQVYYNGALVAQGQIMGNGNGGYGGGVYGNNPYGNVNYYGQQNPYSGLIYSNGIYYPASRR
ncbi:MAG: hypothetical protein KF799_13145 [Bdellovibrionales bacterium]|nr:hypothetical protein [Bdellovibrionales bacterium]